MNTRVVLPLIFVFCFMLFCPVYLPAQALPLPNFDGEIASFMERWQIKGGSVALVKEGHLVYTRSFGQADDKTPMQERNLFRIASLSKPITALAILKLKEQGRLKLNAKVFGPRGILKDYNTYIQDKQILKITVRELLQHTAGWDRQTSFFGDPIYNPVPLAQALGVPVPTQAESIIRYVLGQPLDFKPGTKFAYSNIGYSILGRIIEKISGISYEAYVQANLLHPLGIYNMRLAHNDYQDKNPQEVRYYETSLKNSAPEINNLEGQLEPYHSFNIEAMDALGGWVASATDLAKLLVATDGLPNKPDILSPASLKELFAASGASPNYGLGWMRNAAGAVWHTGSLPGTSSFMALLPNGTGWVILFNGRQDSNAYFYSLDKLLWRALKKQNNQLPDQDLFSSPILAGNSSGQPEVTE